MEDKEKKTQAEQQKENRFFFKKEESLRNILDNMKCHNIYIMGIPEGAEREQRIKNLFQEIVTKPFPYLVKEKFTQVQEAQRVRNKVHPNAPTPRHIIIKTRKES